MSKVLNVLPKNVPDNYFDYAAGYYETCLKLIDTLLDEKRYSELSRLSEAFRTESIRLEEEYYIYPIVFLFRQYIELIIKALYLHFDIANDKNYYNAKKELFQNHKISELWPGIIKILKEKESEEDDGLLIEILDAIVKKVISLDDNSTFFRFPTDKTLNPYFKENKEYDINEIRNDLTEFDNLIHEYL